MSGSIVKIKLRSGSREIELEAGRQDVDELLAKWWVLTEGDEDDGGGSPDGRQPGNGDAAPKRNKRTRRPARASNGPSQENGVDFDAHAVANAAKQREDFEQIADKIIHARGDWYHKVALVPWLVDKPVTSGQIHRVLTALNVKADLPAISRILKANMNKYITTGQRAAGNHPGYSLTGLAAKEFEEWLHGDGQ